MALSLASNRYITIKPIYPKNFNIVVSIKYLINFLVLFLIASKRYE